MSFTSRPDRKLTQRSILILAVATIIVCAAYLLFSAHTYRIGLPLDDAWIHQTYARNLALRGEFAFLPGEASSGSTSPLWTGLLAIGFLLGLSPYIWAYLLGASILFSLALLCEFAALELSVSYRGKIPWIGLFFIAEWHLAWASVSGMETLLHALIAAQVVLLLLVHSRQYAVIGLLIGLSVWVRPDGMTLIAPALLSLWADDRTLRQKFFGSVSLLIGFGSLIALFILFNLGISGFPMPNTFYAKQTEYAELLSIPLIVRIASLSLQPITGAGLALVPGAVIWIAGKIREKNWAALTVPAWAIGYVFLYAIQLPVSYQHGRYQMPMMPIFFLLGLLGVMELQRSLLKTSWQIFIAAMLIAFVVVGAQTYANDVAVIESEMVDTAKWVAQNLPPDAIIAAHDIGALGYFGGHSLIDLAGLIDPALVLFMRDEARLADWIDWSGADYLITFPEWYPSLIQRGVPIFSTHANFAPMLGGGNMTVYRWRK